MICAALMLALPLLQDQSQDDPEYKGWARCKPGAWVRFKDEAQGMVMETTSKLKSVDDTQALLEDTMTTTFKGKTTKDDKPSERKVSPKIPASVKSKLIKEGEEELQVAGKKLKCHWTLMENEQDGKKIAMKLWLCDDVPGAMVKAEASRDGKTLMKRIVTAWEMK